MKKIVLFIVAINAVFVSAFAQPPYDTTSITFTPGSHIIDTIPNYWTGSVITDSIPVIKVDTSVAHLWQMGGTLKTGFISGSTREYGIMTDTLHPYPSNANDYFSLQLSPEPNYQINIWHRFVTDSFHAGGVVEFSTDSGVTWMSFLSCTGMVYTTGTSHINNLFSGDYAFTGNSGGQVETSLFVPTCVGVRTTSTACIFDNYYGKLFVRFRFLSDSTASSDPGWKIDSIEVMVLHCSGGVTQKSHSEQVTMTPNPTTDLLQIKSSQTENHVSIYNLTGRSVLSADFQNYETELSVGDLPTGLYIVRVNGTVIGKLLKN